MGLGFILLAWLAVAAIIGATWIVSLGAWLWGLARRSRALAWLGAVPLCVSSLAAVAWIALMLSALVYSGFALLRGLLF